MSSPKRTLSQELLLRRHISQVPQNLLLACGLLVFYVICMEVAVGIGCSRTEPRVRHGSDDTWEQVWECLTGTMILEAMKRAWNSESESVE